MLRTFTWVRMDSGSLMESPGMLAFSVDSRTKVCIKSKMNFVPFAGTKAKKSNRERRNSAKLGKIHALNLSKKYYGVGGFAPVSPFSRRICWKKPFKRPRHSSARMPPVTSTARLSALPVMTSIVVPQPPKRESGEP